MTDAQKSWAAWAAIAGIFLLMLWFLAPVMAPFIVAAVLAYALTPLVDGLDAAVQGRVPRVLAVVVASPCTAPFMGASLGLAMTLPALQALSIFACMGLGLALPYVLASFMPSVARFMPKPGAWMVTLRQCLGFPMLATVVWLLWVLGLQTHANVSALALMGLVVLACLVWALRYKSPMARAFQALLLAGWLSLLVMMSQGFDDSASASSSSTDSASAVASHAALSATPSGQWSSWSEDAVQRSLAQGQPVFVDFTAAWCVTCQINKQTTLSQASVLQSFAEHKVQLMRADWTRRDPAITRALTALGRSGVPVYVLYTPGRTPVVLSELLSVDKVQQVLRQLP